MKELEDLRRRIRELETMETQCREAEERLKEERDFIDAINNTVDALVVVLDRQGRIVRFNRGCERLTGYSYGEVEGKRFWDFLLIPEEVEQVRAVFTALRSGQFPNKHENFWVAKDGTRRLIAWSNTALLDRDGSVEHVIGTGIDITEQRRATEALRESEARYRTLFENSPISLWEVDLSAVKGCIDQLRDQGIQDLRTYFNRHPEEAAHCATLAVPVHVNKSTLDLYNATSLEDFQHGLSMIFDNRSQEAFKGGLVAIAEGKTRSESETVTQTLTGEKRHITVRWSAAPGHEETLSKVLASVIDITELKALEREKANLVSMLAHDMKSALVAILGFVIRLKDKGVGMDDDDRDKYLEIIRREAARLEFLVDDFLEVSRLQTGKLNLNLGPTPLGEELHELFESYQPKALQRGARLEMRGLESLPVIEADANRLRRAFTNLLDNAIKFSGENGDITIAALEHDAHVSVQIIDHGVGIDPRDLPYIFFPFHRGRGSGKYDGYGVGLASVKTIVEGHGGQVLVDSEPGRGSVFTIILPKASERGLHPA